jgi:hypothetical protein
LRGWFKLRRRSKQIQSIARRTLPPAVRAFLGRLVELIDSD